MNDPVLGMWLTRDPRDYSSKSTLHPASTRQSVKEGDSAQIVHKSAQPVERASSLISSNAEASHLYLFAHSSPAMYTNAMGRTAEPIGCSSLYPAQSHVVTLDMCIQTSSNQAALVVLLAFLNTLCCNDFINCPSCCRFQCFYPPGAPSSQMVYPPGTPGNNCAPGEYRIQGEAGCMQMCRGFIVPP